ncbi:histidine triad nucleotide-binding protein [Fastidiosibacter lacustris]|uniref:histidine triad nucleotide-binding protein n=1 Tax=Fastidiosibacter lacustris TaxID=2056695 RepID=UPI000E35650D|nr:histidine triad nucleotide-binding protein [Fastidiosibacter lacustris]
MSDCIFCKIIKGDIPANKVYEDQDMVAFHDAFPAAETHVLVVPKKHIDSLNHLQEEDAELIAKISLAIPKLAETLGLEGYKTLVNTGKAGGQSVFHLHYHILGGKFLKKDALQNT